MIELRAVTKTYGDQTVLRSFTAVFDGIVCVTGESGRGKTTILRLILGLEAPDSGEIITGGARFGAAFQEDRLFETLNAIDNVRLAAGLKDPEPELLRLLPAEALRKNVKKLSGGQRRRAAIVRAMCARADAFVLDEPFAGLDAENREKAWRYIREKAGGRPVIIALHEGDIPPDVRVIRI